MNSKSSGGGAATKATRAVLSAAAAAVPDVHELEGGGGVPSPIGVWVCTFNVAGRAPSSGCITSLLPECDGVEGGPDICAVGLQVRHRPC